MTKKLKLTQLLKVWVIVVSCIATHVPYVNVVDHQVFARERFEDEEIRVIRPRYFNKRKKLELGAQFSAIMNETFIYTFLASGLASYHLTEFLGVELSAAIGTNIDKEDKRVLFDEFKIKTNIFRTFYTTEAALLWTPIYGKWQLASGRLVYFDTFLLGGVGITGIDWKYNDICTEPEEGDPPLPADKVAQYPTFVFGVGQRYFLSKNTAIHWDLRGHSLQYKSLDAVCNPEAAEAAGIGGTDIHNNITVHFGASKFF